MMKKMIVAIASAMMMSMGVMAQNTGEQQPRQHREADRTEMLKQRTEQTVKAYGLNEEQAQKLLELNTQYADKMPMMGGPRGGMRGGQRGQRPGTGERPRQTDRQDTLAGGQRGQRGGQRPQMNFEEMRKNMEAYNAELQKIMTPEQYQKYQQDQQQRMQQRGGRQGGGRQGAGRPQRTQQ